MEVMVSERVERGFGLVGNDVGEGIYRWNIASTAFIAFSREAIAADSSILPSVVKPPRNSALLNEDK